MKNIINFFKAYKLGLLIGVVYSIVAFLSFMYGLGYGATCDGSECNPLVSIIFYILVIIGFPATVTWMLISFYIIQPFAILINAPFGFFFAIVLTVIIWGFVGIGIQKGIRIIRHRLRWVKIETNSTYYKIN